MIASPNHLGSEEDEKCVPRAAVHKMIKDRTQHIRVSSEAKEFFVQCCNEFIHTLAIEANTVCEQQTKKLVHPDHMIAGRQCSERSISVHQYVCVFSAAELGLRFL